MQKVICYISKLLIIAVLIPVFLSSTGSAQTSDNRSAESEDVIYYFWGYCPVCSKPEEHVGLFEDYPVAVEIYEVFQDPEGRKVYDQKRDSLGIEVFGFPTVVYQDRYWLGFSESVQEEIVSAIEASLGSGEAAEKQNIVNLPLIGEVNLLDSPILLTTAIIAFLDGFNPCSLFVLTFLLAIIVHSASRKRIFIVGLTFLIITAAVYGLFILGVLNIMIFVSRLFWIRNIVAAIVIFLGVVGIKDFLSYKQGITFSIPESYKGKYYRQVRKIFYTDSVIPMITATAIMALGIALIELPCTAGFPFIWSGIIAGLDLSLSAFALLFALYIIIYLSIELVIFLVAVIKMQSIKMTEERGRLLKLTAGSLMFTLGLVLLFIPDFMESILGIVVSFGSAALLAFSVYYFRKIFMIKGRNQG
jgi:cytochrome c biogenesis protein CcdA